MTRALPCSVQTRLPLGASESVKARAAQPSAMVACARDGDAIAPYLADAAHYPGGHTREVFFPTDEAELAALLADGGPVLVVGAQSSLTGGATPRGERVISTVRMKRILDWSTNGVRVGAGLALAELEAELRSRDLYYPPIPTYDGASVGGTVATNAAGAATFKHGTTRDWVTAITVVLAGGEVLDIERGAVAASAQGCFEIVGSDGRRVRVDVPDYVMPDVPKRSAGYYAAPAMDLIDLFIGAEGTLGIVTEIGLRLITPRPRWFAALVPMSDEAAACRLARDLRDASVTTWATAARDGIDVAAVEYIDKRCLELLREDGTAARCGVSLPDEADAALFLQAELDPAVTREQAFDEIASVGSGPQRSPLTKLCALLAEHGVLERTVASLPEETARHDALFRLREAVPEAVNRRVRDAQRSNDGEISKSGGDVIVPFDRFEESLATYRRILERRGLDHAIWGHISDGNMHPNVIARSAEEMRSAHEAQLEIGEAAIAMGGCPMSEHGVGRNAVKQQLLERLYGERGVAAMRAVKRALDPRGVLAPGVLFAAEENT